MISEILKKSLILMSINIELDANKLSIEEFNEIDEYFTNLGYSVFIFKDNLGNRKIAISKLLTSDLIKHV